MKKWHLQIVLSFLFALLITYVLTKIYAAPHIQDIYLSKSQDGIHLSGFEGPVLKGRPVPTGAYFEDGWMRIWADDGIYRRFVRWLKTKDNHFVTGLAVAKSKDGLHFQKERMTLDTFPYRLALLTDPTLIKTKEGRWRLYASVWERREDGIAKPLHSLISDNGVNWQYEGKVTDYTCGDSTILFVEEKNYYVLYCPSGSQTQIAISSDGKSFPQLKDSPFLGVQGAIKGKEGYLIYYDQKPDLEVKDSGVVLSDDGVSIDKDIYLDFPINEPAIIKHPNGWYYYYSCFPSVFVESIRPDNKKD
ncbi:MAG: hypothetical protein ACOZBZ_01105 [Patescibacteria group bacterium]